jgi:hypothetical protein
MMPAAGDLGFVQVTEPEYGVFAEESRDELRMVAVGSSKGQTRPSRMARAAASVRLETPSLA